MIFSTVPGRMALGFALISSHKRGCRYIESSRNSASAPEFPGLPDKDILARRSGVPPVGILSAMAIFQQLRRLPAPRAPKTPGLRDALHGIHNGVSRSES